MSMGKTIVMPIVMTCSNTQDKADCLNLIHQDVIGMKEDIAEAITMKVGSNITNRVLKTVNGTEFWSIDNYQIDDLLAAVLQGADQPGTANVLS